MELSDPRDARDARDHRDPTELRAVVARIIEQIAARGMAAPPAEVSRALGSDLGQSANPSANQSRDLRLALSRWASVSRGLPQSLPPRVRAALVHLCSATVAQDASPEINAAKALIAEWEHAPYTVAVVRGTVREVREMVRCPS